MNAARTGADKSFEETDPLELVGVTYPVDSGDDHDRAMGRCIIEEYALMGWDREQIRLLFLSPVYAGPHGILRRRGTEFVDELIREILHLETT